MNCIIMLGFKINKKFDKNALVILAHRLFAKILCFIFEVGHAIDYILNLAPCIIDYLLFRSRD